MRRWLLVAGIVVAVVAASGFAVKVHGDRSRADLRAANCANVRHLLTQRDDREPVTRGGPRAVVMGDSWAQGLFLAKPREQAWSTILGQRMGWTTYVNAEAGTGIQNAGYCGTGMFIDRVAAVAETRPSVVVIEGGLNDDPANEEEAARALLARLTPVETVVVVGPPLAPARPASMLRSVDSALHRAAAAAGRPYLSTLIWPLPYRPDGLHLTEQGHAQFAGLIAQQLLALPTGG